MKKLTILIFLFILIQVRTLAQNAQWAKAIAYPQYTGASPNRMSLDADAHSLLYGGLFTDNITLGNQTFVSAYAPSNDPYNGFITKMDHSGNVLWAKHIIGTPVSDVIGKLDVNENIVVAGTFSGSLTIDNKTITSNDLNIYLAKFTPSGQLLWLRKIVHTPGSVVRPDLAIDKSGNIIIAGGFQNTVFLHKLDPYGSTIFYTNVATDVYYSAGNFGPFYRSVSLAVSPFDEIFVAPYYQDFNLHAIRKVAKYSGTGTQLWIKPIIHPQNIISQRFTISADNLGNAYICGNFNTPVSFDNITINYSSQSNYYQRNFIAKINGAGKWIWAKPILGGYNSEGFKIKFQKSNQLLLAGTIEGQVIFGNSTIGLGGYTSNRVSFAAQLDTAGNKVKAVSVGSGSNQYHQYLHAVTEDPKGNIYLTGEFAHTMAFGNFTLGSSGLTGGNTYFLGKYLESSNSLNGTLFLDLNQNGIKDTSEPPFPNGIVEITNNQLYLSTSSKGIYNAYLPAGSFTINGVHGVPHYTFSPPNHTVTFSGTGQTQTKDFALTPIPNRNDVKISVTNITPTRPGFITKYRITLENIGTTTLSDSLTLTYAPNYLTFNSATTTPALQQTGKVKWLYQTLQPNEKRNIDVLFNVLSTTPINTKLNAFAVIKPLTTDFIAGNNYDTLNHVVTGSYDPNDKQVSFTKLTPTQVANGKLLDYMIRFQNTGNDTAFTVIVRDSITSKLHMPSFEMLSASHPYTFRLLENGMMEWRFDNIKLVDSTRNERGSHGFIRYRMQPKNTLVLGNEIKSRAAIYFDYNAPVMTNYAITRISNVTGIKDANSELQAFELYPNPANNYVMVAAELKKQAPATVILKNLLGQTISTITLPANNQIHYQLPLNNLAKGVYIVQLETETGRLTQRLVIQ